MGFYDWLYEPQNGLFNFWQPETRLLYWHWAYVTIRSLFSVISHADDSFSLKPWISFIITWLYKFLTNLIESSFSFECQSSGMMESKYKTKEYGSLTERWTTDGTVTTEYSIDNKPSVGFRVNTALNYRPVDSVKSMKLGLNYNDRNFNAGTTISESFHVLN